MNLFINDRLISIVKPGNFISHEPFDLVIDGNSDLDLVKLHGRIQVLDGTPELILRLIDLMEGKKLKRLDTLTFIAEDYKAVKEAIKSHFKVVKAAGGLVTKKDKVLMIYRFSKWDLPKGKLEKDEAAAVGAIREVEEECMIKAKLETKLVNTWHTYLQDGKKVLKKTTWYLMDCIDDSNMAPQLEEDITDLRWMTKDEYQLAIQNSYGSIREVFRAYSELAKV